MGRRLARQSLGICQRTELEYAPVVGLPSPSIAGVKRARRVMSLQVVSSSSGEPLDRVTEQSVTRPSDPIETRKPVTPCLPSRIAEVG